MLNKFVATVITGTICLSAMSAFAVNNRVRVIANCVAYDDYGRTLTLLNVNGYYPIVRFIVFSNGQRGVKIWFYNQRNRRSYQGNISNGCVQSSQGRVILF